MSLQCCTASTSLGIFYSFTVTATVGFPTGLEEEVEARFFQLVAICNLTARCQ